MNSTGCHLSENESNQFQPCQIRTVVIQQSQVRCKQTVEEERWAGSKERCMAGREQSSASFIIMAATLCPEGMHHPDKLKWKSHGHGYQWILLWVLPGT